MSNAKSTWNRSLDEALADLEDDQVRSVASILLRLADLYDTL